MELIIAIIIGIISLGVLIKSSDIFTNEAENIGLALGVSSFIIGLTVVSIGTSLPELVTSLIAVSKGFSDFPIDNIIGSNIANSLLVIGLTAVVIKGLKIKDILIDIDIPFLFIVTSLFIYFIYNDKVLSFGEGSILIILMIIYITYTFSTNEQIEEETIANLENKKKHKITIKNYFYIILSAIGIFLGAKYTLKSVEDIANILNTPKSIITMIGVGLGTSLPELVVSISAGLKGKHGMVIGNIFGSNIFNILFVGGLASIVGKTTLSNEGFSFGLPFLIIALFAFIFSVFDNKIKRWEGALLLILYLVYILKLVNII